MIDRSVAPRSNKILEIDFPKLSSIKLDNKIPIFSFNSPNIDVCKIELVFEAGTWYESKNGVSFFTIKSLLSGTKKKKANELQELIDYYGAFSELNHGPDFSSVTIYSPTKNLDKLIHLLNEVLFESIFPEEEIRLKKLQKEQQVLFEESKNNAVASKKFKEILFEPNHPYGRKIVKSDINELNRVNLVSFYDEFISKNSFKIFISGSFHDSHLKLLNSLFGKHEIEKREKQTYFPVDSNLPKEVIIEKAESNQSSIRLGKLTIKQSHRDFNKLQFINTLLGGFFGSRLIKNIREEKGFTYGIYSSLINFRDKAFFLISTEAKKESRQLVVDECIKEIKNLKENLVSNQEMDTVKNYLVGSIMRTMDSPFNIIEQNKKLILLGIDEHYLENYFDLIKKITPEECCEIANEYFSEDQFSKVIVG